jgi:Bacterial Ig-like domain
MTRLVVLLAALLAATAAVQGSQATFTASATNSGASFATATKFPPTVTVTAPANGSATNDTTPTLSGTADNSTGDSTSVTVKIYSGPTATGTALQTKTVTRSGTTWSTTASTLAVGTYTVQATQTDTSGNTGTSNANTFTVDTSKPTATSVTATNKAGGTAGKIENGDTITFTYSEPIAASSVWSGWDGSSTSVNVRFTNSSSADTFTILTATTGTINLGSVATNGNYVSATTTFASTMVRSADGASIVVTLGTPTSVQSTPVTAKNMTWTVGAGITDLAGNVITTPASSSETVSDVDF